MPDEYVRITVDTLQGAQAISAFNQVLQQATATANQLGISLAQAFQSASVVVNASGQVLSGTAKLVGQVGTGAGAATATITTGFNNATTATNAFGQSMQRSGGFLESFGRRVT